MIICGCRDIVKKSQCAPSFFWLHTFASKISLLTFSLVSHAHPSVLSLSLVYQTSAISLTCILQSCLSVLSLILVSLFHINPFSQTYRYPTSQFYFSVLSRSLVSQSCLSVYVSVSGETSCLSVLSFSHVIQSYPSVMSLILIFQSCLCLIFQSCLSVLYFSLVAQTSPTHRDSNNHSVLHTSILSFLTTP